MRARQPGGRSTETGCGEGHPPRRPVGRYDPPVRRTLRPSLVSVGLAAALCCVASLTGGCGSSCKDEPWDVSGTYVYSPADTRTLAGLAPDAPLSGLLDLVPAGSKDAVRGVLGELERGYRVRLARGEVITEGADSAHPGSWRYRSSGRYEYKNGVLRVWLTRIAGIDIATGHATVAIARVGTDWIAWPREAWPEELRVPFELMYRREPTGK